MKNGLLLFLFIFLLQSGLATHNRAGEITYKQIGPLTIEATITTYTKDRGAQADRDSLQLNWGDGTVFTVRRVNGIDRNGELLANNVKLNQYKATHTYAKTGSYTLGMVDPNRNGGILNVNSPASDQVPFYLETEFVLDTEVNSAPVFYEMPIDNGFVGKPFKHIVNAFDFEGDSISYKLITPLQDIGEVVPNYLVVTEVGNATGNTITIDDETGLIVWNTPQLVGEYVIAILITTYNKNGIPNCSIIRDMQITIKEDRNQIQVIDLNDTLEMMVLNVGVGDTVNIPISYSDEDTNQEVTISSSGGLYEDVFSSPALFSIVEQSMTEGKALFEWIVADDNIRAQSYQVVFKTTDNFGLSNFAIVRFKVEGSTSSVPLSLKHQDLEIYPNPSSEWLFLKSSKTSKLDYRIYNYEGKVIQTGLTRNQLIDINLLTPGTYFITFDQFNLTRQFIKK